MEYLETTFSDWSKTHDPQGRVMVFCKKCDRIIIAPEGIYMINITNCPRCNHLLNDDKLAD